MLKHAKAIVLHSIKYGDSGIIAQTYTNLAGRQSFLIHGVRKKKSTANAYLFQPLNVLDIVAYMKQRSDLHKVKEIKPSFPLHNLHFEVTRSTIAVFLGEILYRTLRETETQPQLFDYLENAIQVLDTVEKGLQNFHLIFLLQLTKFLGIFPGNHTELENYKSRSGNSLQELLGLSLNDISQISLGGNARMELLDELISYYRDHIDGMGVIRSLEILHEVFHQ